MPRYAARLRRQDWVRRPWFLPATLLVILAALALLDPGHDSRRRPAPPGTGGDIEVLGAIEPDPANPVRSVVRIQWNSLLGAESYEVRFFSLDMHEVGRHFADRRNALVLDLQQVWQPVAPARALLWRVVALRDGDEIGASGVQTLRLP